MNKLQLLLISGVTMDDREKQLNEFRSYLKKTDSEITMVLQNLQWDRKQLLKDEDMQMCKHNANHRIPTGKVHTHEKECYLKSNGYLKQDLLLPDPTDHDRTLIKLSYEDIKRIILNASNSNSQLKKVWETIMQLLMPICIEDEKLEPLSLERLQSKYTCDERRAIYDAVVAHTPSQSDISELELPGIQQSKQRPKTKQEVLAELRDMKRRRPKYRVATKSKNYSEVLREVIKNQMEWYAEIQSGVADITYPETTCFKSEEKDLKTYDKKHTRNSQTDSDKLPSSSSFKYQEHDEYNNSYYMKKDSDRNKYNTPIYSKFKSSNQNDMQKIFALKQHKRRHNEYDHYKDVSNEKRSKHQDHSSKHATYHRDRYHKTRKDCEQRRNREH